MAIGTVLPKVLSVNSLVTRYYGKLVCGCFRTLGIERSHHKTAASAVGSHNMVVHIAEGFKGCCHVLQKCEFSVTLMRIIATPYASKYRNMSF